LRVYTTQLRGLSTHFFVGKGLWGLGKGIPSLFDFSGLFFHEKRDPAYSINKSPFPLIQCACLPVGRDCSPVKFAPHCTGQGLLIESFSPAAECHACVLQYTSAR
jgi:hypothetical protein